MGNLCNIFYKRDNIQEKKIIVYMPEFNYDISYNSNIDYHNDTNMLSAFLGGMLAEELLD